MVQDELLKRISQKIDSINSSPKFTLSGGLVFIGIGIIMYLIDKQKWIAIDGWWILPLGIGVFLLVLMYPISIYTKTSSTPLLNKMYRIVKDNPRQIVWAYKLNTYRNSVIIKSTLVLNSNSGEIIKLPYNKQEDVNELLMAMPIEINPAILIGYTKENKMKYFNKK